MNDPGEVPVQRGSEFAITAHAAASPAIGDLELIQRYGRGGMASMYRVVGVNHRESEADARLTRLNRHFPTRAPRSQFGGL